MRKALKSIKAPLAKLWANASLSQPRLDQRIRLSSDDGASPERLNVDDPAQVPSSIDRPAHHGPAPALPSVDGRARDAQPDSIEPAADQMVANPAASNPIDSERESSSGPNAPTQAVARSLKQVQRTDEPFASDTTVFEDRPVAGYIPSRTVSAFYRDVRASPSLQQALRRCRARSVHRHPKWPNKNAEATVAWLQSQAIEAVKEFVGRRGIQVAVEGAYVLNQDPIDCMDAKKRLHPEGTTHIYITVKQRMNRGAATGRFVECVFRGPVHDPCGEYTGPLTVLCEARWACV